MDHEAKTEGAKTAAGGPAPTDAELLLRFRDHKDHDAFDELVHRYERELYSYLYRYVGNAAAAEDLFQATFLRVYEKADQYDPGRRVRPWLYSIATHLAVDWMRKAGRRAALSLDGRAGGEEGETTLLNLLESSTPGPPAQAEAEEQRERVRQAVNQLPEDLRAVAVLIFFQGLKYSEAAEILGIPLGTVKSRVHSALVRLNKAWQNQQD